MKVSHAVFAILFFTGSAFAQNLDFGLGVGVKGGWPVTDVLRSSGTISVSSLSSEGNFIIGPVAEIRLPFGFAFEADGLYRKSDYSYTANGTPMSVKASSWEVPYMAKFRFPIPLIKPFIFAGGAYRSFNDVPANTAPSKNGFVAGLGIELRILRLRGSVEGRYLRWGQSTTPAPYSLARDQGEILLGLIF